MGQHIAEFKNIRSGKSSDLCAWAQRVSKFKIVGSRNKSNPYYLGLVFC